MPKLRFHRVPTGLILYPFLGLTLYSCGGPSAGDAPKPETAGETKAPPPLASKMYHPDADAKPPEAKESYNFVKPKKVKGIYVTAWSAGGTKSLDRLLGIVDRTELNAMVIDVRDSGDMYFKTGIPLAKESKAEMVAVPKPAVLFAKLAKHQVWPIARIACFRDTWVPKKHPELAVQLAGGKVWKDRSGHSWLDPYNKANWDYIAKTVDFAMDIGFPEIQLDYVRFPSEGKSSTQIFPGKKTYSDPKAKPEDVIAAFAHFIGERVRARKAVFSADIFGIISSSKSDQGIGQELEKVAEPFDLISPMVYPSHFAKGEYGIPDPNRSPYAILTKSLGDYKKRLPDKAVRPWIQDFSLGYHYGPKEVQAQIKAAHDLGYDEFLLWNAGNRYTEAALAKDKNPTGVTGTLGNDEDASKSAGATKIR